MEWNSWFIYKDLLFLNVKTELPFCRYLAGSILTEQTAQFLCFQKRWPPIYAPERSLKVTCWVKYVCISRLQLILPVVTRYWCVHALFTAVLSENSFNGLFVWMCVGVPTVLSNPPPSSLDVLSAPDTRHVDADLCVSLPAFLSLPLK